jgi:hypothetical protein
LKFRFFPLLIFILALAACNGRRGQSLEDLPTPASADAVGTAIVLTENAPPADLGETVSFPEVDRGLNELAGWRYIVHLEFEGVFARTPRETSAEANAEVWFNQVASARRVMVETAGELLGREEDIAYEAVKLGPDAFLLRDNVCLSNTGTDAQTAADLRAGTLVGGVQTATSASQRAVMNGLEAWKYSFDQSTLNLPSIRLADGGKITLAGGELWVAPEQNVVPRFYVNLDVENAYIFDRTLPVTGQVIMRYDLYDVGVAPNITVPFGC